MDIAFATHGRRNVSVSPTKMNPQLTPERVAQHQQMHQIPYVIYRSSKYNGFLRRINQYFIIYSRFYILQPLLSRLNQFHIYLLEFLGFCILLLAAPLLLSSACVLYLIRKARVALVGRFHPNLIICEDLSPRCILMEKSHGIVTAVVWTHGKITREMLRHELISYKRTILRKILTDKFGLRVWTEVDEMNYDLANHIIEAPSKFYQVNLTDEDSSQGQKSSLQKFITSCASKRLNLDKPPWEITLIPQPSHQKEKTCCVLRFHYLLLRDQNVRRFIGDIFTRKMQSIYPDGFDDEVQPCKENPIEIITKFTISQWINLKNWVQNNFMLTKEDFKTWVNLRKKELEFHSKSTLLRANIYKTMYQISQFTLSVKSFPKSLWPAEVKEVSMAIFLILRALSYIPTELFNCFWGVSAQRNGISRAGKSDTRQVAWSTPIPKDFLEAIHEKTNASLESVILTACSLALRDYYDETGLKNPNYLHVSVSDTSDDLLAPSGFRTVRLPTERILLPEQLNNVNSQLKDCPAWKILGSYYILTNVSYLLPRAIAYLVLRKIFKRYPINFTCVDLEPQIPINLPTISLWGHSVDEFIFWRSPHSDFCVSITLVKYMEMRRVAVFSPMKSVDRALTKYFGQYLNRIAESLGVNKSRIPYSQRSSPSSSHCSSPSPNLGGNSLRNRMRLITR